MTYLNPPDLGGLSRPTGIPTREKLRRENLSMFRLAALFFVLIVIYSCEATEPKLRNDLITLTLIDVSVTEAYIHVKVDSTNPDQKILLKRDGKEVLSFNAGVKDTIVTDKNLTKSTTYSYSANLVEQDEIVGGSNKITLTTLEPTSHDIKWETYSFGATEFTSNSSVNDVAIIDENSIWAVGEVYLADSLGNYDRQPYASVCWDGSDWNFIKVPYKDYGDPRPPAYPGPLFAVSALDDNNVYAASYANFLKYVNGSWIERVFFMVDLSFNGQIKKIWLKDEGNAYCTGNSGSIYYVSDNSWEKLESGTNYSIYDIWGYVNPLTQNEEMLCAATDYYEINKSQLLKITDVTKVDPINLETERFAASVWTNKGYPVYVCGDGIFSNKTGQWKEIKLETNYFTNDVRGNGQNDLFIVGDFGLIAHFNGLDWIVYKNVFNAGYKSLSVKNNIIAAVGQRDGKAIITIGRRN